MSFPLPGNERWLKLVRTETWKKTDVEGGESNKPFAVWNDFDTIFKPSDLCVIFIHLDLEFAVIVFDTVLPFKLTGKLVRELYKQMKIR